MPGILCLYLAVCFTSIGLAIQTTFAQNGLAGISSKEPVILDTFVPFQANLPVLASMGLVMLNKISKVWKRGFIISSGKSKASKIETHCCWYTPLDIFQLQDFGLKWWDQQISLETFGMFMTDYKFMRMHSSIRTLRIAQLLNLHFWATRMPFLDEGKMWSKIYLLWCRILGANLILSECRESQESAERWWTTLTGCFWRRGK